MHVAQSKEMGKIGDIFTDFLNKYFPAVNTSVLGHV